MNPSPVQFATSVSMGVYEPFHQINMWENALKGDISPNSVSSTIVPMDSRLENKPEYPPYEAMDNLEINEETSKASECKVQRRLAQNREAARKCRLKKKAYVHQLETCRLKLTQLEQELQRTRQQGLYFGGALNTGQLSISINPGIAAFEMEYRHWVEEQQRQLCELRSALQVQINDVELCLLVENGLNHYFNLFQMKADAAKADVFYLMSGTWKTSVERFFLWIGGFRPSELLNAIVPQLDPLTDQQVLAICKLRQSSVQAEDALSQGMDKLQQSLGQNITTDPSDPGNYGSQMASAMEKLDAVENFVNQADHLRQQTLIQMSRILTTRQAARGLLALGEYFQRLHALNSLWAARPRSAPS